MIVVHIESGLGNQMLAYCEYLSLKYANPNQDFYIETIVFDIPECNEMICQWNGYELEKLFRIDTPKNIKTLFSEEEWSQIMDEIRATEFWIHNWNYPVAFTEVFRKHGLNLENVRGDFDPNHNIITGQETQNMTITERLKASRLGYELKRWYSKRNENKICERHSMKHNLFFQTDGNIYTGQWLAFKRRENDRHLIDNEIRAIFKFPKFDKKNAKMADYLRTVNSVAIHARRGDMEGAISWCYNFGYFRRAIKIIRKNVENPVFVFFTNPSSISWCKDNAQRIFGLNIKKDTILFVDWNKGEYSYRDMQLMGQCKHAVITPSTFGWWGAYFINNPQKITISPSVEIDTTLHC